MNLRVQGGVASKLSKAFMAVLPFESAKTIENYKESFSDLVDITEKDGERDTLRKKKISKGKIGYFDIFKIAGSLEENDYLKEGETAGKVLSNLFSKAKKTEKVQPMLNQRNEIMTEIKDLVKNLQEELDEVYGRG